MSSDVLNINAPYRRIEFELLRKFKFSHDLEIQPIHIICPAEDIRRYAADLLSPVV